ncbi:MAG TPA: glycosyltransferase family 39 protein [bacterium]|nr:glycosyltransferase family 39 protein [bacterium]
MTKKIILITLLSFLIRIYLFSYPPLLWDEASLGYNAYSILKTGKDEYGKFLPLIFKSFGDYKPGLYIYLTVPFVFIFGLNTLSVRLPSIILGSLSSCLLYLLITTINPKKKKNALLSALLLSITPFHIHFSRGAWETNILTFQILLASYFFYKFIKTSNARHILSSAIIFGLSLYTYQSAKMISFFFVLFLFLSNIKFIIKNYKTFLIYFVFPLFIFSLFIATRLFTASDSNRLKVLSIFSYPKTDSQNNQLISYSSPIQFKLFNNNTVFFTRYIFQKYFNHLSPYFLFFKGDWSNPRHSAIYTGVLLLPSIIFLPLGLISTKVKSKISIFFLFWLLVAPIPSALTRDSITAVRSASLVIPLTYFTSHGLVYFFSKISKYKIIFIFLTIVGYLLSFFYYNDLYFNHTAKTHPSDYLYGYKQAVEYINKNKSKYENIYLSDFYGQPYIFYLFYSQYPPHLYQKNADLVSDSIDVGKIENIDNIFFQTHQFSPDQIDNLTIFSKDEILRQQLDKLENFDSLFDPIGVINNQAQFYAYPKN